MAGLISSTVVLMVRHEPTLPIECRAREPFKIYLQRREPREPNNPLMKEDTLNDRGLDIIRI